MAKQIRGVCRCCSKEYTKSGIVKHLQTCKGRTEIENKRKTTKTAGYFELLITAKYQKEYWLVIEIEETSKLKDLDQFLRDIWVECCGHLSSFHINGINYDSVPSTDYFWGPPSKSMNIQLKKVLQIGADISYEYDFGSTTELIISVKNYKVEKKREEKITILSRNNPPEIICSICEENIASWVDPEGYYDGEPFLCEECLGQRHKMDFEDDAYGEDEIEEICVIDEYLLPVCNSPRMGVCGYEGSSKYPE